MWIVGLLVCAYTALSAVGGCVILRRAHLICTWNDIINGLALQLSAAYMWQQSFWHEYECLKIDFIDL